jgi:hypothetical protein
MLTCTPLMGCPVVAATTLPVTFPVCAWALTGTKAPATTRTASILAKPEWLTICFNTFFFLL